MIICTCWPSLPPKKSDRYHGVIINSPVPDSFVQNINPWLQLMMLEMAFWFWLYSVWSGWGCVDLSSGNISWLPCCKLKQIRNCHPITVWFIMHYLCTATCTSRCTVNHFYAITSEIIGVGMRHNINTWFNRRVRSLNKHKLWIKVLN